MKYLIVGGHGFIGSHFSKLVKHEEYDIYDIGEPNGDPSKDVIDARKKGLKESINEIDPNIMYDYVVHFGCYAGIRSGRPMDDYYRNNCLEYIKLLEKVSFKKLIYISSSSVLGDVRTAYSISKEICEEITKGYDNHLIIRPFTVYGLYGRPEMFITRCIENDKVLINGDPSKIKRKFTYVGDLVQWILTLKDSIGVYNATGDKAYSLKEVMDIFDVEYECGSTCKYDFTEQFKDEAQDVVCTTTIEDFKNEILK